MTGRAARWLEPATLGALAVAVAADTARYPGSLVPGAPGPAFFPRVVAAALLVCAVLLALRARAAPPARDEPPAEPSRDEAAAPAARGRAVAAVLSITGFLALAPLVGTFAVLPLLIVALMALMGERSRPALVAAPLLFTLFVYVVFFRALGVGLPTRLL